MFRIKGKILCIFAAFLIIISVNTIPAFGYVCSKSAPCVNTFSSEETETATEAITENITEINTKSPDTGSDTFEVCAATGLFISLMLFVGLNRKGEKYE